MNMFLSSPRLPLSLVLLLAPAGICSAQEGAVTFEFSLSNPGARSMALGGAFAALADDATAAFANPAGLVQLLEPELSVEARSSKYDTTFVESGRAAGSPSQTGIDTESGLSSSTTTSRQEGVVFASYVVPFEGWSLALYHHVSADFELSSQVNGIFGIDEEGEDERSEDVLANTRVKVENTGLAAGIEVLDTLSLGLSAVYFEAEMNSFYVEYGQDDETFYQRNAFPDSLIDTSYSHVGSSSGVRLHAGLLWQPRSAWSIGAFYRRGQALNIRVVETVGPADDEVPAGTIELDATSRVSLPDVYGAGVAYRTDDGRWTASFETARVGYSAITDDLNPEIFERGEIRIEDGTELRFGAERVFIDHSPLLALRAGIWRDPAHRVGAGSGADQFERAVFQPGDDEWHLTAGLGIVFDRFQVDLGADFSDLGEIVSASAVYRF